jgi:hypothetical protein
MSRREFLIAATAGALIVALLVGFAAFLSKSLDFDSVYDNEGGPRIAEAIRDARSPIVTEVRYQPGDFADPASIHVVINEGSGAAEISAFVANVIPTVCRAGKAPVSMGIFLEAATGASAGDYFCP